MDVSFKHRAIEPIQTSQGSQHVNTFSSGRSWSPSATQAVPVRTGGQIIICTMASSTVTTLCWVASQALL